MKTVDMETYRNEYLRTVEEKMMRNRKSIPHFTTSLLEDAIRTELTRADTATGRIEVPEDQQKAMKEAEERMMSFMKENKDLGTHD